MNKLPRRCFVALGCALLAGVSAAQNLTQNLGDAWPARAAAAPDPALEAQVERLLAGLTLKQKIGQMTQAEIQTLTPAELREYAIGSVLNGGGSWPGKTRTAAVTDWRALSQAYQRAALAATPGVGLIWGIDAVHGNGNIHGATLFPHHTGLGATGDEALVRDIGRATAAAVRAAGIQWVFAPTLAVVQDVHWGRTYESYGADPQLVRRMGRAEIEGLQDGLMQGQGRGVVATAKHFVGDGGTTHGVDQGLTRTPFATLASVHGAGYYGALDAHVQTVMASFNSWQDSTTVDGEGKMHGSALMLTEVLKKRLGFDGFVISDWDGIGQVPGCANDDCPQAINAGVDMIMLSTDWRRFIANTLREVEEGRIPMARVDDAVRRILRVKLRAGLAAADGDMPPELKRLFSPVPAAELQDAQANPQTEALARRAVRESLVLLKHQPGLLPLAPSSRVLVIGSAADNMSRQVGGWSKTWMGNDTTNADFPQGQTALAALRAALGADHVVFDADAQRADAKDFDAVIAVLGEKGYAEGAGDIKGTQSLRHSVRYPEDLAVLERAKAWGKPVVTLLFSGRPLYVNDLAARSDAFIAAWLPGTEGLGLADMLVRPAKGEAYRFTGRLSFPWPAAPCQFATDDKNAWWPVGGGLSGDEAQGTTSPTDVPDPVGGCVN